MSLYDEIEKHARAFHIRSLDAKTAEARDAWSVGCGTLHQIANALAAAARQGGDVKQAPGEAPQSGHDSGNAQKGSA